MEKELTKILIKGRFTPDPKLLLSVWNRVVEQEKRRRKIKLYVFSFVGLFSFTGFVPVFVALINNLTKSGFFDYWSVVFSNNGTIISYWKELILSLTDSLPMTNVIYTLILVSIFLLSFSFVIKQIIKPTQLDGQKKGGLSLSY